MKNWTTLGVVVALIGIVILFTLSSCEQQSTVPTPTSTAKPSYPPRCSPVFGESTATYTQSRNACVHAFLFTHSKAVTMAAEAKSLPFVKDETVEISCRPKFDNLCWLRFDARPNW